MASPPSSRKVNFFEDQTYDTLFGNAPTGSSTEKAQLISMENATPVSSVPSRPSILKVVKEVEKIEVKATDSEDTEATGEEDLVAVREQCQFIKDMVRNLNYEKGDTHPQIRKVVADLHGELRQMLVVPAKSTSENTTGNSLSGAIPKSTKYRERECSDNSSSETFEAEPQTQARKRRYTRYEGSSQPVSERSILSQTLIDAIAQIDGRRAPKPEEFDLSSGRSFQSFLMSFEEYCSHTFKGSSSLWSSELKLFLKGTILQAFEALHAPGEPYGDLKKRLLQFSDESQELIDRANRKKFEQITMRSREPLRLYAARIERDFRLAHPRKRVNVSSTLTNKFLETVPSSVKRHILNTKSIFTLQGHAFDWNLMLKLISSYEVDKIDSDPIRTEPDVTEVWATTSPMSDFSASAVRQYTPKSSYFPQSREFRSTSYSPGPCSYCKRPSHNRDECWRLNRRCLACGSPDHRIAQCSRRRSAGRSSSVPPSSERRVSFPGYDGNVRRSSDDVRVNQGNSIAPAQQGTQRWS